MKSLLLTLSFRLDFSRELKNWSAKPKPENNLREHWGQRQGRMKKQRAMTADAWTEAVGDGLRPRVPALVCMTRLSASSVGLDLNTNLSGSMKGFADQVAKELGVNDRSPWIKWIFTQDRCAQKQSGVIVEVTWSSLGQPWPEWQMAEAVVVRPRLGLNQVPLEFVTRPRHPMD